MWVVTILSVLVFGGISAYWFYTAERTRSDAQLSLEREAFFDQRAAQVIEYRSATDAMLKSMHSDISQLKNNPNEYARYVRLYEKTGLDPSMVFADLTTMEREAKRRIGWSDITIDKIIGKEPKPTEFLSSPKTAAFTHDAMMGRLFLGMAVGVPVALWTIFVLIRWIGTRKNHNSHLRASDARITYAKLVHISSNWMLNSVFLFLFVFAVNVLILPSGRALEVLISTAIQGAGLFFLVLIISKISEARQIRTEENRIAQSVASVEMPEESNH
jgi:hypothetical protein